MTGGGARPARGPTHPARCVPRPALHVSAARSLFWPSSLFWPNRASPTARNNDGSCGGLPLHSEIPSRAGEPEGFDAGVVDGWRPAEVLCLIVEQQDPPGAPHDEREVAVESCAETVGGFVVDPAADPTAIGAIDFNLQGSLGYRGLSGIVVSSSSVEDD